MLSEFSLRPQTSSREQTLFADDFEHGLGGWRLVDDRYIRIESSGDPTHGNVLVLVPGGEVLALIRGSERWRGVRLDADVLFPANEDSYLGVVYHLQERQKRKDFGAVYIKGNGSYLQGNPHYDFNPSRALYPESQIRLEGGSAIRIGKWQRLRVEVVGRVCHFYVGDVAEPQLTFPYFEGESGAFGLEPRIVGGPVWIDNVRVTKITRLSYTGAPRPGLAYTPEKMLTLWQVAGPFTRTEDALAEGSTQVDGRWRAFAADARGAAVTAKVVDYHGPQTVAYFRTIVRAERAERAVLHISTADNLALWVNGRLQWLLPKGELAWFDFASNPAHNGQRIPIDLKAGANAIVLRTRGGVYASGGFFATLEHP